MQKRTIIIALLAAVPLVAVGSGVAFARWGHSRGHDIERAQKFVKWRVNDMLEEIDATEEQTEKVNAVVDELIQDALPMIDEHRRSRGEFKELFFSDSPDPEEVHRAIDARISKFGELAHKAADAALEVHGTLTPEQRAELEEMMPDHGHH